MNYQLHIKESLTISGISCLITKSQSKNYKVISNHWKYFNEELKLRNIKQGKNWQKFGVFYKVEECYFYLTGIKTNKLIEGFEQVQIPNGSFASFLHKGSMQRLQNTYNNIYKKMLPQSGLAVDLQRTVLHYELYDKRFNWNRPDSLIEILVPLAGGC